MAADNGPLARGAEIMVAAHALGAGHAAFGKPAEADTVAGGEIFNHCSHRLDASRDFVTGDERVCGKTPLVAEHAEVRVADATVFDADVHMLGPDGREFVGERFERRGWRVGCVGVNGGQSGD